jgi:copper homeostasis protein
MLQDNLKRSPLARGMDMIIEICANSFASAQAAQDGEANRIELCTDLSKGGLTPSHGLIKKVIEKLNIPVHVLIRPRGGDFIYSKKELDTMLKDIAFCKKLDCSGIVSGVLTSENTIDEKATRQLIEASKGMEFTFHRAFDCGVEVESSIRLLMDLGVTRLLSSGQQNKAIDGIKLLNKMKLLAKDDLQIMPGSGINAENALAFKESGFEAIHFSATKKANSSKTASRLFANEVIGTSDQLEIERIKKILT